MSVGIFATKIGMTQLFDEFGTIFPVTLLKTKKCQITQIKTIDTDGYSSIQLGYENKKITNVTKANLGHLKKSGNFICSSFGEFRVPNPESFTLGQEITLNSFTIGQNVRITGKSIGKGFTGNQKRHNFSRGLMTHGSKNHRLPGSVGAGSTPGRVFPGKKMAGQLGNKTVTIKRSKILFINHEENILVVQGSVPGKSNSNIKIQSIDSI
jgi:large subunit ribosomal protein L3